MSDNEGTVEIVINLLHRGGRILRLYNNSISGDGEIMCDTYENCKIVADAFVKIGYKDITEHGKVTRLKRLNK